MPDKRTARLIGSIYDAALEPTLWVQVMEGLARQLGGATACMTTLDVYTGLGSGCAALAPEGTIEKYFSYWTQDNPLHQVQDPLRYVRDWRPNVIRYEDWIDPATLHGSGFFNDFLQPLGAGNGMMMGIGLIGTSTVTMNIARPMTKGMFTDSELIEARRWQEHLSRAVRLGQAVQGTDVALAAIDKILETTPQRLFFLDPKGQVLRLSSPAEAVLREGCDLYLSAGILSACRSVDEAKIRRLIAGASPQSHAAPIGGSMTLLRSNGNSFDIQFLPLNISSVASWSLEPLIMVMVVDGQLPLLPMELRVRSQFGLTAAEARIALALMRGSTLREVAVTAEVSINTVRVHLASIFKKTGLSRQVDLVRLLLAIEQKQPTR